MNIDQYIADLKVFVENGKNAIAEYWCYGLIIACVLIVIRIGKKMIRNAVTSIRIKKSVELRDWGLPFWSKEEFLQGYADHVASMREKNEKNKGKNGK